MILTDKDIFHVHSFRCGHAKKVPDEAYVERAISIGAVGIWFTDHSPFPGDKVRSRMRYEELDEYIATLKGLKEKYAGDIEIHIGLEVEYLPSFDQSGYYRELKSNRDMEILILGQHMAEVGKDEYTYSWDPERLDREEYILLGEAMLQGMESGYFDAVAHPDRIFRRQRFWSEDMRELSERIIFSAERLRLPLEQNESSRKTSHHYWSQFWEQCRNRVEIIHGLDAHSPKDIRFISEQSQ